MSDVAETPPPTPRKSVLNRLKWFWICTTWYVLSIGPMYWPWHHSVTRGDRSLVEVFYRPLVYACEIPPIGSVVNAYIELWVL
jgi:hypothetical protein